MTTTEGTQTGTGSSETGTEKINTIVDEVDRFFQAFHADIEDWKFSMEDYGDGTRIFVRFQIHLNNSGAPGASHPTPTTPQGSAAPMVRDPAPSALTEVARDPPPGAGRDQLEPEGHGTASRADLDLASFVEHWRATRANDSRGEFHKDGAPYMDAGSEWKGQKEGRGAAPTDPPSARTDEERKSPDAST
jgi:hypothetical protein